jgi:prepilin-type N-terminal cleavage/methylation domain-containing protein
MDIHSRASLRHRGGFSLAEMLIVLVIIGIALAMAVPRMQGVLHESALQGSLNQVASDLTLTRLRAVRGASRASLTINAAGTGYTVVVDPTGTPQTVKTVSFATDPRGLVLSPANTSVTFDSRGLLVTGTTTIVAARQGRRDSVFVTGVGRVYRGY